MLLTISTTRVPATDLGYLLHKHPDRLQSFALPFGQAHVFYPEAGEDRCTAALLLDVDPVGLVRGRRGSGRGGESPLERYVNDRPYTASSFLSVAISGVFGSALGGRCKERPELVSVAMPLAVTLDVLPCRRGGEALLRRLFEPLGYGVETRRLPLDVRFPEWGDSPFYSVGLERVSTLREVLAHLYVLVPVLDDGKHYYIDQREVDKLLRHGSGWLDDHPAREEIAYRYLLRLPSLTRQALERIRDEDREASPDDGERADLVEESVERPLRLNDIRMDAVYRKLVDSGAQSVVDLGCGEGRLLKVLASDRRFKRIAGLDPDLRSLERAAERLRIQDLPEADRERLSLWHGSMAYRDPRIEGFDAATLVEVIEHVDPQRLRSLERVVFEFGRPRTVIVTTPNAEYNVRFPNLAPGSFRHPDHRFEWTRGQFAAWAASVGERLGFQASIEPVGEEAPGVGAPTQMAVFVR